MTLADSATTALVVTAACAVAARLGGALTTDGAIAGAAVGACVSLGFGLPGLAVLGTFFVVGTLATRIGWATKKARGTAEAGEGRRDWKRVLGKGGVAAVCALAFGFAPELGLRHQFLWLLGFMGSVAAALADTLGTEIGTLSTGSARLLPTFRRVPVGTSGAVTASGTVAAVVGAAAVAAVGWPTQFVLALDEALGLVAAGTLACLAESIAVGMGLRAPGFARNVLTTAIGALSCALIWEIVIVGWRMRQSG